MNSTVASPSMDARTELQPGLQRRVGSVDLMRGAVMILMAIDHVRVFSGVPAGGPTAGIFFTRWVTNFCAPAFLFLAGTSIFFYSRKHANTSQFLLTRGLWLILLELTFLRIAWTFNFDFRGYEMAGVIWVIGCCMILMAGLVKLPLKLVGAIGVMIIAAHNLLDSQLRHLIQTLDQNPLSGLWKILYVGFYAGPIQFGPNGPNLTVLYSIIPVDWCDGGGLRVRKNLHAGCEDKEPNLFRHWRNCYLALFLVLRGFNLYGDLRPWHSPVASASGRHRCRHSLRFLIRRNIRRLCHFY